MAVVERPARDVDVLAGVKVIDTDSHVWEPADLWTSRLPASMRDVVPHVETDGATGKPIWVAGGDKLSGGVGVLDENPRFDRETWDGRNDPAARLRWMDRHGLYAQVLFPNMVGFYANRLMCIDADVRLKVYQTYNDYQAEFASYAPDRLIPLANLPFWDVDASVNELERCIDLGHKGVNFGWRFEELGMPALRSDHWAPLFRAVEESELAMNIHVGFNGDPEEDPTDFSAGVAGLNRPAMCASLAFGMAECLSELIMGGVCHKYPRLNWVISESGVGYIPFHLETLDWYFLNEDLNKEYPEFLLPSEYFRRQVYGTFWYEKNVTHFAALYPDNFMFESDYTHQTSLTPTPGRGHEIVKGPRDTIIQNLSTLEPALLRKLVSENAARVYHVTL
jgi:predicted TIM-barrel fold metal-dependent hydrolase